MLDKTFVEFFQDEILLVKDILEFFSASKSLDKIFVEFFQDETLLVKIFIELIFAVRAPKYPLAALWQSSPTTLGAIVFLGVGPIVLLSGGLSVLGVGLSRGPWKPQVPFRSIRMIVEPRVCDH